MTYQELINRPDYNFIKRNYPGAVSAFTSSDSANILMIQENYIKRGNNWILENWQHEYITYEFYINTIGAIPFFRNWGGYERVEQAYTPYGYMPVKINSISPDRMTKTIRKFEF